MVEACTVWPALVHRLAEYVYPVVWTIWPLTGEIDFGVVSLTDRITGRLVRAVTCCSAKLSALISNERRPSFYDSNVHLASREISSISFVSPEG